MSADASTPAKDSLRSQRRWLRYSLRTLLMLVTVFGVWLGVKVNQARRQKQAVEALLNLGATVRYAHQRNDAHPSIFETDKDLNVPNGLRALAGDDFFQSVVSLRFSRPVTDEDLAHLAAFPHLEQLDFYLNGRNVTDAGLANLPRPDRLTSVYADLSGLRKLGTIYLSRTRITGAGLKHLVDLPGLADIHLAGCEIDLPSLLALRSMNPPGGAISLTLDDTLIRDDDLKVLAQLRNLGGLSINRTKISDAGLAHLHGLPNLTVLNLAGTGITENGIAAIKQAMPTLRFVDAE
jgi:hypothetical protein